MINSAKNQPEVMDRTEADIIRTLLYFDIFSYPLLKEEIIKFSGIFKINVNEAEGILNRFVAQEYIFKHEKFYSLHAERNDVTKRLKGNRNAEKVLKTAKWISRFIGSFPFVRGVYISGTLSKGYADEESDIDYFIVTEPGRLWIARTLLTAFKKIFLFNSRKYFCTNYFIDSDHLEISDKNRYTATELLTLIPMYNSELFEKLITSNTWTECYLPNYKMNQQVKEKSNSVKGVFIKGGIEKLLGGKTGERIDSFFLKLTLNRLKRKFSYLKEEEFEHALRSRKYISKHHPRNYQKIVLNKLEEKIEIFEREFNVQLSNG